MTEADAARARILEQAEQSFFTRGYSRLTMDELCAELRMSKKTLYRFFSSKEALGEAVLVAFFARLGEEIALLLEEGELDFAERLRRFMRTVAGHYARGGSLLRELQRDAPVLWQKLTDLRRESVQARFGALYAAGVKAGAFRADVEPRLVIRIVLTLMDQLIRPDVLAELELSADQAFTHVLSVVLDGVRTGGEPQARRARPRH